MDTMLDRLMTDVRREAAPCERLGRKVGVWRRRQEIPPERKEHPDLAGLHGVDRVDGVEAVFAWRFECVPLGEAVKKCGLRPRIS